MDDADRPGGSRQRAGGRSRRPRPSVRVDRDAHRGEHSLEVQLPLLVEAAPGARIVPLAVSAGTGRPAIEAGARLGRLLAARRSAGERVVLAISSDMAHYPPADACARATETLLPAILDLDPAGLAAVEADMRLAGIHGLACGMCGIEPAVLGLAALRAMGAVSGTVLAAMTSADAGGPRDRTVGYLAVRFDACVPPRSKGRGRRRSDTRVVCRPGKGRDPRRVRRDRPRVRVPGHDGPGRREDGRRPAAVGAHLQPGIAVGASRPPSAFGYAPASAFT